MQLVQCPLVSAIESNLVQLFVGLRKGFTAE